MSSVALTSSERACLQQVRHYVAEGIGNRSGWARAGTPLSGRWTWDELDFWADDEEAEGKGDAAP